MQIVPNKEAESSSESEEEKIFNARQSARQDKEESSSESDKEDSNSEVQPQDPEDNEEDEFPVALNGLVFSFLPSEIAEKLNNANDWK